MQRHLSMRWRFILAFLAVSVPPMLASAYVATVVISTIFEHNVEKWLKETTRFSAAEILDGATDAARVVGVLARALTNSQPSEWDVDVAMKLPAELLVSTGYELIVVYDGSGGIRYSSRKVEGVSSLPLEPRHSLFRMTVDGRPALIAGAVESFTAASRRFYVLVADIINDDFVANTHVASSLDLQVFRVDADDWVQIVGGNTSKSSGLEASNRIIDRLRGTAEEFVADDSSDLLLSVYAPIKDASGELIAVVRCGLRASEKLFEHVGRWRLFLAIFLLGTLGSVTVGSAMANRLVRPVKDLTRGVRSVAAGDYAQRIPERGGQELEELASVFNRLVAQLAELRAAEAEMRKRQQLATLGEAAAVLAHEIRNPLGIIKTSSQFVHGRVAEGSSEQRVLGYIGDEVDRIENLVRDILDFVRPRELHKVTVVIDELIERLANVAGPEFTKHRITFEVDSRTPGLRVVGDPDQIYQAFLNIVINAIQAMPNGGRVGVRSEEINGSALIAFSDTGPGVPIAIRDRIFEPFVTTKARGAGLGLAKVQAIIEAHAGRIHLDSASGQGTRFMITLPTYAGETVG